MEPIPRLQVVGTKVKGKNYESYLQNGNFDSPDFFNAAGLPSNYKGPLNFDSFPQIFNPSFGFDNASDVQLIQNTKPKSYKTLKLIGLALLLMLLVVFIVVCGFLATEVNSSKTSNTAASQMSSEVLAQVLASRGFAVVSQLSTDTTVSNVNTLRTTPPQQPSSIVVPPATTATTTASTPPAAPLPSPPVVVPAPPVTMASTTTPPTTTLPSPTILSTTSSTTASTTTTTKTAATSPPPPPPTPTPTTTPTSTAAVTTQQPTPVTASTPPATSSTSTTTQPPTPPSQTTTMITTTTTQPPTPPPQTTTTEITTPAPPPAPPSQTTTMTTTTTTQPPTPPPQTTTMPTTTLPPPPSPSSQTITMATTTPAPPTTTSTTLPSPPPSTTATTPAPATPAPTTSSITTLVLNPSTNMMSSTASAPTASTVTTAATTASKLLISLPPLPLTGAAILACSYSDPTPPPVLIIFRTEPLNSPPTPMVVFQRSMDGNYTVSLNETLDKSTFIAKQDVSRPVKIFALRISPVKCQDVKRYACYIPATPEGPEMVAEANGTMTISTERQNTSAVVPSKIVAGTVTLVYCTSIEIANKTVSWELAQPKTTSFTPFIFPSQKLFSSQLNLPADYNCGIYRSSNVVNQTFDLSLNGAQVRCVSGSTGLKSSPMTLNITAKLLISLPPLPLTGAAILACSYSDPTPPPVLIIFRTEPLNSPPTPMVVFQRSMDGSYTVSLNETLDKSTFIAKQDVSRPVKIFALRVSPVKCQDVKRYACYIPATPEGPEMVAEANGTMTISWELAQPKTTSFTPFIFPSQKLFSSQLNLPADYNCGIYRSSNVVNQTFDLSLNGAQRCRVRGLRAACGPYKIRRSVMIHMRSREESYAVP
ncbi:hypothetical protein Btru_045853, partial [Bulinus truncatus]